MSSGDPIKAQPVWLPSDRTVQGTAKAAICQFWHAMPAQLQSWALLLLLQFAVLQGSGKMLVFQLSSTPAGS